MPRFVVLEHDHPLLHWDLMLEAGPMLRTWRLAEPPEPGLPIAAEALADHRLFYLDYEGPVSNQRGFVKRWDAGIYGVTAESSVRIEFNWSGMRTSGHAILTRMPDGDWSFELRAA